MKVGINNSTVAEVHVPWVTLKSIINGWYSFDLLGEPSSLKNTKGTELKDIDLNTNGLGQEI